MLTPARFWGKGRDNAIHQHYYEQVAVQQLLLVRSNSKNQQVVIYSTDNSSRSK